MDIILYKNTSPNNALTKSLSSKLTISGTLREQCSITEPEIIIEHKNPVIYNYLYIAMFKRFYYITSMTSIKNKVWKIKCHVDVLNTYRTEILQHQAIIDKQENAKIAELYLDDGDFVVKNKKYVTTKTFSKGLSESGNYILITAGA